MKFILLFMLLSTPAMAEAVLSSVSANVVDVVSLSQDPTTGKVTVTTTDPEAGTPQQINFCDATGCYQLYAY